MASIHDGHRKRLKEEFRIRGLEGMADNRALELLLFYAIPQGDVNPLAHELLDRFGNLASVFHVSYEELLKVNGVGPNTAALIRLVPALGTRYMEERASAEGVITSTNQYIKILQPYFFGAQVEMCYMLCLDAMFKYITCCKLGEGVLNEVPVILRKVVEKALACNATYVILAHNHVSGLALPSPADVEYTGRIRRLLNEVGVVLVDHVIIKDDDAVSMKESNYFNDED